MQVSGLPACCKASCGVHTEQNSCGWCAIVPVPGFIGLQLAIHACQGSDAVPSEAGPEDVPSALGACSASPEAPPSPEMSCVGTGR